MTLGRRTARAVRVTLLDATGQPDAATARTMEVTREGDGGLGGAARPDVSTPGDRRRGPRPPITPLPSLRPGTHRVEVVVEGWRFELEVEDAARAALRRRATREADATSASGPLEIRAIIPGRVAAVRVTAGDDVAAGDTLLVVEAMKMQNELRAARSGQVARVAVGEGQTIEIGDLLVVLA